MWTVTITRPVLPRSHAEAGLSNGKTLKKPADHHMFRKFGAKVSVSNTIPNCEGKMFSVTKRKEKSKNTKYYSITLGIGATSCLLSGTCKSQREQLRSRTARRMLPAAWPQNADTALRMQDAFSADGCSLLSHTQLHHISKIMYLRQQGYFPTLLWCFLLTVARTTRIAEGGACSRAWQCLRLLKITADCLLLALHCPSAAGKARRGWNKARIRPSLRLSLHPLRSRKQPHWRLSSTQAAAPRADRPGWCSLAGTELCIAPSVQLSGERAESAHEHKSTLLAE